MKCPVCGKEVANPNSKTHVKSQKHQDALQQQGSQTVLIGPELKPTRPGKQGGVISGEANVSNLIAKYEDLKKRVENIEKRLEDFIPSREKIPIQDFKRQLFREYDHLNPSNDISGVEFESLQSRVCRELQISPKYYEELIYDLQREGGIITVQSGREKKYIQVKNG